MGFWELCYLYIRISYIRINVIYYLFLKNIVVNFIFGVGPVNIQLQT